MRMTPESALAPAFPMAMLLLPVEMLQDEAGKLLPVSEAIVDAALDRTLAAGDLVKESIGGQDLIFLPSLKRAEEGIAARIKALGESLPKQSAPRQKRAGLETTCRCQYVRCPGTTLRKTHG